MPIRGISRGAEIAQPSQHLCSVRIRVRARGWGWEVGGAALGRQPQAEMDPREQGRGSQPGSLAFFKVPLRSAMSLKTNLFLTHNRSIPGAELVVAADVMTEEEKKKKKERGGGEEMRRKVK